MKPDDLQRQFQAMTGRTSMTSTEMAAMIISGGRTANVQEAEIIANAPDLSLDAMTRAHLRRQMGFNFQVKTVGTKIHCYAKEGPRVSTSCKVFANDLDESGNIISEALISRLVNACMRLKIKWDAEKMREEAKK